MSESLTKDVVAQEARFVLDHLSAAAGEGHAISVRDLSRICNNSISLSLADYLNFLDRFGYVVQDRDNNAVAITDDGEAAVAGDKMADLVIDVVHHFRPVLTRRRDGADGATPLSEEDLTEVDSVDARYEKLSVIGSGGIGTVYLARQVLLDRQVVLKEIRELFDFFTDTQRLELCRRFDEQIKQAARLSHPNVAAILDGNGCSRYPYVVSEYIGGGNLKQVLDSQLPVSPDIPVKLALQLLRALEHAHSRGVIHRGLKPENVLLDGLGNARVTDFGLARVMQRDQHVVRHVYIGSSSVAYLAPETLDEENRFSQQSDLYAVGIMLYELLTGRLPGRRCAMPSEVHSNLPRVVDELFDQLTQDDPAARYGSASEALEAFYRADGSEQFLEANSALFFVRSPFQSKKPGKVASSKYSGTRIPNDAQAPGWIESTTFITEPPDDSTEVGEKTDSVSSSPDHDDEHSEVAIELADGDEPTTLEPPSRAING